MRIIVEFEPDYWNSGMRKSLMQFLIHNCKVVDEDNKSNFKGCIIEPKKPYPIIPLVPEDSVYEMEW